MNSLKGEIARLREGLENRIQCCTNLQMTNDKLRAALEEIVRNGDQGIHVPGPYDIAKAALTKQGKHPMTKRKSLNLSENEINLLLSAVGGALNVITDPEARTQLEALQTKLMEARDGK